MLDGRQGEEVGLINTELVLGDANLQALGMWGAFRVSLPARTICQRDKFPQPCIRCKDAN